MWLRDSDAGTKKQSPWMLDWWTLSLLLKVKAAVSLAVASEAWAVELPAGLAGSLDDAAVFLA